MTEPTIEALQNRGLLLREKIYDFLQQHEFASQTRNILLIAYVAIVLEHHEAIFLLIKSRLYGSAFALVRSLFDAVFRALWINACATEDQINTMVDQDDAKLFPKMDQMVASIDQTYSTDNFFTSMKDASWAVMCSYTHSGLLQIMRRFTGEYVKPNYQPAELIEVMNSTTTAIILLSRMFFMSAGCEEEAAEVEKMMADYARAAARLVN